MSLFRKFVILQGGRGGDRPPTLRPSQYLAKIQGSEYLAMIQGSEFIAVIME